MIRSRTALGVSQLAAPVLLACTPLMFACGTTNDPIVPVGPPVTNVSLPFKPSNLPSNTFDSSKVDDVVLSGTNCDLDSETKEGIVELPCATGNDGRALHSIVTLADQSKLSIFVVKSLRIEASTVLALSKGNLPVVLVALSTMTVLGSIKVSPGTTGGNFSRAKFSKGSGQGGGTAGDKNGAAPSGGAYCGIGGKGGATPPSVPVALATAYGNPALIPLLGGSTGGTGDLSSEGDGGGALQLVAGTSFTLGANGFVSAGGGGGQFAGIPLDQAASAGGSGGAILIESMLATVAGKLAVNGGGGGQGDAGSAGAVGNPDQIAKGGSQPNSGAFGGDGSFAGNLNGGDGVSAAGTSPSGAGGGGAGRIRINTKSGQAAITGTLSPLPTSACATQGVLAI